MPLCGPSTVEGGGVCPFTPALPSFDNRFDLRYTVGMQIDGNDMTDALEETMDEIRSSGVPKPMYEDEVEHYLRVLLDKLAKKGR